MTKISLCAGPNSYRSCDRLWGIMLYSNRVVLFGDWPSLVYRLLGKNVDLKSRIRPSRTCRLHFLRSTCMQLRSWRNQCLLSNNLTTSLKQIPWQCWFLISHKIMALSKMVYGIVLSLVSSFTNQYKQTYSVS